MTPLICPWMYGWFYRELSLHNCRRGVKRNFSSSPGNHRYTVIN